MICLKCAPIAVTLSLSALALKSFYVRDAMRVPIDFQRVADVDSCHSKWIRRCHRQCSAVPPHTQYRHCFAVVWFWHCGLSSCAMANRWSHQRSAADGSPLGAVYLPVGLVL